MSNDLDTLKKLLTDGRLKNKIDALAAKASPRFGSSRLLVTLGMILGLVWFFHGQLGTILDNITLITVVFLAGRTLTDALTIYADGKIKCEIAKQLTKDGTLSSEDQDALDSLSGNQ